MAQGVKKSRSEKIMIANAVCRDYAEGVNTLESILRSHGIGSRSTWHKWQQDIELIEQAFKESKEEHERNFRARQVEKEKELVSKSLLKLIEGYHYHEEKTLYKVIDGQHVPISHIKYKRYKRPNAGAVIFIACNRLPDQYKHVADLKPIAPDPEEQTEYDYSLLSNEEKEQLLRLMQKARK